MRSERRAAPRLRVQASLQRRRRLGSLSRRNEKGRVHRKDPAQPAQPVDVGRHLAGDGEAAAGMLVRVLGLKTDCTQNKEEPIYLDQEDCRSCTKQTQFKDLDTTC